LWVLCVFR